MMENSELGQFRVRVIRVEEWQYCFVGVPIAGQVEFHSQPDFSSYQKEIFKVIKKPALLDSLIILEIGMDIVCHPELGGTGNCWFITGFLR